MCLFQKLVLVEMERNSDDERLMEDMISGGQVPTYTDEERSQADGFLNIPGAEDDDTHAEDDETHAEDDDTHAEDLQDDNADGSNEVYILCIKFIIINFLVGFT